MFAIDRRATGAIETVGLIRAEERTALDNVREAIVSSTIHDGEV